MKVLSIIEPFATLICENKKYIETRSWKTNYRGEIYIHASNTNIPCKWKNNSDLMKYVGNKNFNFGMIICKCILTDCIYMTEEFIDNLKKNNNQEYELGDYKVGRYAWILEDTQVLDSPIPATGQLNIWDYYSADDVMKIMQTIDYGWIDKDKNKYLSVDNNFCDNYTLQAPKECLENKIGICWDQVELERYLFRCNKQFIKTFFIVYYDGVNDPSHTFLTIKNNNKYYWFEHSWKKYQGIHEFNSIDDLLVAVKNKFIKTEINSNYDSYKLVMYEYKKPKYHLSTREFYAHCENSKMIVIK